MIAGVLEIQLMANMSRLSDDMRRTERVVGDSMTKVERSVASASRALSSLGLGVSIGLIADQMRRTADSFTKLDAQIRLSTKSQEQYNQALGDIRRISTIAQSDISATTMLYTRLLNTTDGMGISQAKLATVTETVSYGLKAYGATSAEAASAALQLSQAMGANRLGGEEFRAVMEAMPNVMKVLAKSMGVPLGELRALSIAGKITTAEMVKAFGDPAVAAEFKKMAERAQTITGAWTVARNELTLLFGEFAKSSGITGAFIAAFNGIAGAIRITAQYVDDIVAAFIIWSTIMGGKVVASLVAARMNQILLNAAHAEALAMNVAMEKAAKEKILSDIASTQATIVATAAKHEAALAAAELSLAEQRATIAQLEHARAAGLLSGHLYIVRTVEAELAVATDKLNVSTAMRNSLMSRQAILHKEMIASTVALSAAETRLAAAETLVTASSKGFMARMTALVGKGGVIGLILWTTYEIADYLGIVDKIFKGVEERAAEAAAKREGMSLSALNTEISNLQKMYEAQVALEKSRTGMSGAFAQATVGAFEMSSVEIKRILDATIKAAAATRAALLASVGVGVNWSPSDAWQETYMTKAEENAKKLADLTKKYQAEVASAEAAGAPWKVRLALAEDYVRKYKIMMAKADGEAHTSAMKRMLEDLTAANEAEVSGKLSNVEKVTLAWHKLTVAQQADAQILADKEAALTQARIADWRKIRDQIADSITRGIMEGAKAEDVLKDMFKQMVLEPTVKLAVTAGVDWVASMLGNTTATTTLATSQGALIAALNANTAAQGGDTTGQLAGGAGMSSGTMIGYVAIAAVVYGLARSLFGFNEGNRASGRPTYEGTFSKGGNFVGGSRQGYERNRGMLGGGTAYWTEFTAMSAEQTAAINKHIQSLQVTFDDLGFAVGDLSVKNKNWVISLSGVDDLTLAITETMGATLLPALEQFRLAGENLAQTAQRLTGVFNTTNNLILSLGVSSKEAFGSLGISSATARQALIDAAGGIDAFNQKAGSFIQNFLTDAQKLQPALDAVGRTFYDLGISGVTTNKQFADLVAAELKLGHYDVVDRLLSVGDAFNAITSSAKATQDQLLSMLKTSSFETLVSYQRARGQAMGGGGAASQIDQSIIDASKTLPEESAANESAARKALKEAVFGILNRPPIFMGGWPGQTPINVGAVLSAVGMPPLGDIAVIGQSGMLAWYAQLQAIYDQLPAFATGGDHMGGLRLVGENGPELEATGPSRIYTASQTASMLSDGMGGTAVADEVRMLRREAAAHAIALNTATQKLAKIADRWDLQGLPPERIAA